MAPFKAGFEVVTLTTQMLRPPMIYL